jgi:hypothetical protein
MTSKEETPAAAAAGAGRALCFCADLLGFNLITSRLFLHSAEPRCTNAHSH